MNAPLIELEQAQRIVRESVSPLAAELVELRHALGRVLTQDVASAEPVPSFESSAMDGFAVRSADVRGASPNAPARLTLVGESSAGHPAARSVGPGEAMVISTGAMMPAGADAVVRIEDARSQDTQVQVLAAVQRGQDVRAAGEDIGEGAVVLTRGQRVGPAELAVLASVGCANAACSKRPRLSVVTTGDELLEPWEAPRPGTVRNTNGYAIPALALRAGAEVSHVAHARDDPAATESAIAQALQCDVAVICGGVSVGPHDHVKDALAALKVKEHFWGLALRPGKPTWFGARHGTLVFGLPGNPISAMVTFILLVDPALRDLSGEAPPARRHTATLTHDYEKRPGRAHAVRCRLRLGERGLEAEPIGPQGSHILSSMLSADALAIIPSATGPLRAGEKVRVEVLTPWLGWLR